MDGKSPMLKFNGRPLRAGDFEKAIAKTMLEGARKVIRGRLDSIRHPLTGEFPTVVIRGDSLSNLHVQVEGSPQLLVLVRERLSPEDLAGMTLKELPPPQSTKVFLSYGGEDRELAKLIAGKLVASGIDTWWAEWEIRAGDSLRQKIDEGLASCTHFLVLLTPIARTKPWVNQEMDAGLVRRLQQQCRFIPLRHNLSVTELPPLLSGMLSPEIDASASDLQSLINQILDVNRKPALGGLPKIAQLPQTNYSAAATAIARVCVLKSTNGETGEVQYSIEELATQTELSSEDVADALHELQHFFVSASRTYMAKASLYAEFDKYFTDHDPSSDAVMLAAGMVNDEAFPTSPAKIAERLTWTPRRLNSALTYLMDRDLVRGAVALSTGPFVVFKVDKRDATRRFLKSRT